MRRPTRSSASTCCCENHAERILKYEPEQRAVLRLSLEPDGSGPPDLPMNRGLRIGWIEDALAPLRGRLPDDEFARLVHGIGATFGIEAFVWLTDVAGPLARRGDSPTIRLQRARHPALGAGRTARLRTR